jgi:hypothetical protein
MSELLPMKIKTKKMNERTEENEGGGEEEGKERE